MRQYYARQILSIHGMHAWTTLDDNSKTLRLKSDEDWPCPATALDVEYGTTRTFSL
jgi:hypothetical protein